MAKGTRKLRRASVKEARPTGKERMAELKKSSAAPQNAIPDPLGPEQKRSLYLRITIIVVAAWLVGGFVFGFTHSVIGQSLALGVPALVTVGVVGILIWTLRQAQKARGMATILREAQGGDREGALAKLESKTKKKDAAAIFAKAQIELNEDPEQALRTLEQIDLTKVMAPVADEARAQRALIHLMRGEVGLARQLVDNIELKRHQDPKTRAMMASVSSEAWARSGDAKKGLATLEVFDIDDEDYRDLAPQLCRAYAFCYAHVGRSKDLRRMLRRLMDVDVRLLGAFMMKRTHPLLAKEAKRMLEQSGQVPRRMQVQRRV